MTLLRQIRCALFEADLDPEARAEIEGMSEDDYIKRLNPRGKFHSAEKWDITANRLATYIRYSEYDDLLDTVDGVEYRASNRPLQYVKYHPDNDLEPMRDENRELIYMTDEEVRAKGGRTTSRDMAAFISGHPVGTAADEWGAVLVQVAREYRGKGIGPRLAALYRAEFPFKDSGGFTSAGDKQARKVYRHFTGKAPFQSKGKNIDIAHTPIRPEDIEVTDVEAFKGYPEWFYHVMWKYKGKDFHNRQVYKDELTEDPSGVTYAKQYIATMLINRELEPGDPDEY